MICVPDRPEYGQGKNGICTGFQREAGTMNYENPSAIVEFCNDRYDNEFMAERFQSMTMNPENASRVQ